MESREQEEEEEFDKESIELIRKLFQDHEAMGSYIQLNEQEGISNGEQLVEFVESNRYKPSENSDDVVMVASLMIVLNSKRTV